MNKIIIASVVAILLIGGVVIFSRGKKAPTQTQTQSTEPAAPAKTQEPAGQTKTLKAAEIANVHADYKFSATIPESWQAQAVTAIDSINIYDPAFAEAAPSADLRSAEGFGEARVATEAESAGKPVSNLEKSQIFIRKFSANSFLTLSTVTSYSREETKVNGRPAVRYDIEKKSGVADFPNQPSWRNQRHIVTDVRVSDDNPSIFYVIARRPDLDDKTYQQFLDSFQVIAKTTLIEPIDEFLPRITKKPFGIFITPETSPVQPEHFRGHHTAVDVEYEDVSSEVPVKAIADGQVAMATTASGYGGVLVIRHKISGKTHAVIYGHLDPKSLPRVGKQVKAGEQVGVLGDHQSAQTDGARKHLHFGIRADDSVNIKGYVQNTSDLSGWLDPLDLL